MKYICDTAKECGLTACFHRTAHKREDYACKWDDTNAFFCPTANCRVRCNSIVPTTSEKLAACPDLCRDDDGRKEVCIRDWCYCPVVDGGKCPFTTKETHTCYFCDHTGQDVNRIAKPISRFKERQTVYCCDNAILCDERWQQLGDAGTTAQREERLSQLAHLVKPWLGHKQPSRCLADDDLKTKVREAIYSEVSQPGSVTGITARATANVMRIIELPF